MKKHSFLAMLAVVLVFGVFAMAFVGCSNEPKDDPPVVTEWYTVIDGGDYNVPTNEFSVGNRVRFHFFATPGSKSLVKVVITFKRGGTEVDTWADEFDPPVAPGSGRAGGNYGIFTPQTAGSYTVEVYVEDVNGLKSETKTYAFTVQ